LSNSEDFVPRKKLKTWQITLAILAILYGVSVVGGLADTPVVTTSNSTASIADTSWRPTGFSLWREDFTVAWRWLDDDEFTCKYGDACWGIMVVTEKGCPNSLYSEVSLLDDAKVQLGYTNDSLSTALPLQKSKMIFHTFEDGVDSAVVSKIKCY
jgi:hypothetical protein